jgi:hypothetical protein
MDLSFRRIPAKGVVPLDQMVDGDNEDTMLLQVMAAGAENYIRCFPWCKRRASTAVIPVDVPATPENAADVERRMNLLQDVIVPAFREAEILRT